MAEPTVLELIEQAARENATYLDLSRRGLKILPPEIAKLTNLTGLSLNSNQLTTLPLEITKLTNLTKLSLRENQLTTLSPEIAKLTNLRILFLSSNQLTTLPPGIAKLTNLRTLFLSSNQLTTLPLEIAKLTNLTELSLSSNQLTTLPLEITKLTNLTELSLSSNQLTTLPPEIAKLTNLTKLYLRDNPLVSPPPEIASQAVEAIREYFREGQKQPQWVSKLLVVGQGGAGKTSLLRQLLGEEFSEEEATTRGIAIRPLALQHPTLPDVTMTLNTWDFAGQEIEHATHQFFLTNRSLFVIVWNARQGYEASRIPYWLETIKARAGANVSILLVATHTDQRTADLPLVELQRDYPQIIGSFAVSNQSGNGIAELLQAIAGFAADRKILPLMGELWPAIWLDAATKIRATPDEQKKTSLHELHRQLEADGLNRKESEILIQWMHELGDILHFRDNEELKDLVILKPQWVTQHIAQVFKSEDVIREGGLLSRAEMEELWPEFEREFQERMLDLMEQFDLSYRTRENPEVSLVVERVPFEEPTDFPPLWESVKSREHCREVTMKYELSSIPAGIPTWFIARQHRFSLHLHWRSGVLFGENPPTAPPIDPQTLHHVGLLQTYPQTNALRLTVRGPFPVNFFALLRDGLEETLRRFPGLGIKRKIPCLCGGKDGNGCPHEFDYDNLLNRVQIKPTIECPLTAKDVLVEAMLTGIGWQAQDVILERLETLETAEQKRHEETQGTIRETGDRVIADIADKIALAQREFLKEFEELQRLQESACPNVFVLHERERNWFQRLFVGKKLELQLLCQEPGDWHTLWKTDSSDSEKKRPGVYEIDEPAKWLRDMSPYMLTLIKFLKYVAPLASPLVGLQFPKEEAEELEKRLKLMEKLIDKLPDIDKELPGADSLKRIGLQDDRRIADSAQLRALRNLLTLKDPDHNWGGLERVRTPEGHYLWLCPFHAAQYRR